MPKIPPFKLAKIGLIQYTICMELEEGKIKMQSCYEDAVYNARLKFVLFSCLLIFLCSILLISCKEEILKLFDKNDPYVLIKEEKISLRFSSKGDIETILGSPASFSDFERGGEGFYWEYFQIAYYAGEKLIINYNQDNDIIRITANVESLENIKFLGVDINQLVKDDILYLIDSWNRSKAYISDNFIMYENTDISEDGSYFIVYSFWFDEMKKLEWIDIYYNAPW